MQGHTALRLGRRQRAQPLAEINVVPYIDVMLVLLIIFMVTAPLMLQGIPVSLPHTKAKTLPRKTQPLIVTMDKRGRYYFNHEKQTKQPLTKQTLMQHLNRELTHRTQTHPQHTPPPVYLRGDGHLRYERIVTLMHDLQTAGATTIGLLTDNS